MLPLMPITALAAWEPAAAAVAPIVASFSMYPLLQRDGVALAYAACLAIYAAVILKLYSPADPAGASGRRRAARPDGSLLSASNARYVAIAGLAGGFALHVARSAIEPPAKLPWLWDRAFISLSFVYIVAGMVYFNWRQWNQPNGGLLAVEVSGRSTKFKPS